MRCGRCEDDRAEQAPNQNPSRLRRIQGVGDTRRGPYAFAYGEQGIEYWGSFAGRTVCIGWGRNKNPRAAREQRARMENA